MPRDGTWTRTEQETDCEEATPDGCESPDIPVRDAHERDPTLGPGLPRMSVLGPIVLWPIVLGPVMKTFLFLQPGKLFKFLEFFRACFRVA